MLSSQRKKIQSTHIVCLLGMALLSLWPSLSNSAAQPPALPQAYIDTTYSPPAGKVITVKAGDNLQTAINNANLGDTIVLQAGATFTGNFTLPNKTIGSGWIYIVSGNYASLPAPGNRVAPTDVANMPQIVSPYGDSGTGTRTAANAHHYRFVGIEFKPVTGIFLYSLISIGGGETSLDALPHDIIFDRCYIHGDPIAGGRRGVAMNGASVAVIDSYVSDFKQAGSDTQALWAYNSPGPLKIANNYLEAAGENVMFGGADPKIANLVPSDIEIKRNYFFKPLSWMGSTWTVKNLLEFKNAQRVLVEGNRFENNWPNAQNGFSLLITPKNQDGTAPWVVTQDITIKSNSMKNLGSGINISAQDGDRPIPLTLRTHRVLIQDNVLEVTGLGNADGRTFQILGGVTDLTIVHNTAFNTAPACCTSFALLDATPANDQFIFANNIVSNGVYGFNGSGTGGGNAALNHYFTNWQFNNNAIIGENSSVTYPANNYFPANNTAAGFVNYAGGDYHLSASSPYKNAGTDGLDLGANIDAIADISTGVAGTSSLAPPIGLKVIP